MISKGAEWGSTPTGPPDVTAAGGDPDLAAVVAGGGCPLVRFAPDAGSDVGRVVGLAPGRAPSGGREVPMDILEVAPGGLVAVNALVLGVPPDRLRPWHRRRAAIVEVDGRAEEVSATGIVVLTGQFLRGFDLNPRSHPGDGALEAQSFGLPPGQRQAMRRRLLTGSHLPHPAIGVRRGRRVSVRLGRPWPLEIDGRAAGAADHLEVRLAAGAYRLLL